MDPSKQRHTFISYSRVNKEFALKLARELKASGFPVWLDVLDIPTGARWDDEIERALRECGIFLTILTPASTASENAKDEMGYAIDHGKRILPVLLQECEIPLRLRRFQYVDFTTMNYDQGVRTAKELLGRLIKEESAPTPKRISPSKERPTQPSIAKSNQLKPDPGQPGSSETVISARQQPSAKPMARYAGIAVLIVLALLAGAAALGSLLLVQEPSPTSAPTEKIIPIKISSPTTIADTPTAAPQGFYTEEFEGNMDAWTFIKRSGKADNEFHRSIENGKLVVEIDPKEDKPWAHLINPAFKYADVQLEVVVTNNGNNANGVSLICRYSDSGWIEFTLSNDQTYTIYVFDSSGETLQGGSFGSKKILSGKETNVYTATCKGNELSLSVDGTHLNTIKINHDFPEGNIGIGFSAPGNLPVDLAFESLKVSAP